MMYSPEVGDVADSTWRAQAVSAFAGNYIIDGCGVSLGDSTTSIETTVESGTTTFAGDYPTVEQQTVTHPDGPAPGGGPEGEDEARVDLVTIDANGNAGRMVGTPAVPNPPDRRFPNVVAPVPPTPQPSDDVVVSAALWIPAGTDSSAEMFADFVIPREVMGDGLNDIQLLPGRDLQYVLDTAREGATLRGDRSHQITLTQPLAVNTPDVTIRDLDVVYGDGVATADTQDMITVAADGVTLENLTLDGNKAGQSAEPDGITVTASDCTVENVRGRDIAGHLVNVNGTSRTVRDTSIEKLRAEDGDKEALVIQGDRAIGTSARNVRSARAGGGWGTVLVRNGPNETTLEDIRGEDQSRVLHFADFGPDNDASAPVQNVTVDGLKASGCDVAIDNDLSFDLNHARYTIRDVNVAQMTPGTDDSIVGLAGVNTLRVLDSNITGSFTAGRGIGISTCAGVRLAGNMVGHGTPTETHSNAGIYITNSTRVTCAGETIEEMPHNGLVVVSTSAPTNNQIHVTGTETFGIGNRDLHVSDSGDGELDRVLVANNPLGGGGSYYVNVTGNTQRVIGNFGTSATS